MTRVNASQLAKLAGVSRQSVCRARASGRIEAGADGRYDLESCAAVLMSGRGAIGAMPNLAESRQAREAFRARREKLEVGRLERELLPRKEVIRLLGDMIVTAKTNLRGIGSKLAADLGAETSAAPCQAMVDREIDAALRAISGWTPA